MTKKYRILPDGSVEGLYDDTLAGLGATQVQRASRVEFNEERGGWTVEFLIGKFCGCFLPRIFQHRSEALLEEVHFLNNELVAGRL